MEISSEQLRQIIKEELEAVLDEKRKKKSKKKDACYHKVRSRYDVWPSAYASGALVKCRKVGAKNWGNSKNEELIPGGLASNLEGDMERQHKEIAEMHGVSVEDINKEVEKGIKIEMEHTDDDRYAHEIAMDHVYEDPKYYSKMSEVYSDKQRRFMCAKSKQGADRPKGLSKKEAEEMCKGPMKEENKAGTESSKESSLHDWFKRKGEKGSKGGWVDCNAPDGNGGYKECAQGDRDEYPACRPTPGACKEKGRGSSWGKKSSKGKKK